MADIKKPNVVLLVIDALRARNLGCYGYHHNTSPNIDNLASEGVIFERAYSCTNATDPSLLTILSGKYPLSHGILNHAARITDEEIQSFRKRGTILIPEILKTEGYETLAVDWLGKFHKRGYDHYGAISRRAWDPFRIRRLLLSLLRRLHISNAGLVSQIYNAKNQTDQAITLIRKAKSSFFLFVHYWDTHVPYSSPRKLYKAFQKLPYHENMSIEEICKGIGNPSWRNFIKKWAGRLGHIKNVLAKYDSSIAYVDQEIGRLANFLEDKGMLDETLFIITSDHGESLTEHEIYFDHHGLYDVNIHVPLILRFPKLLPRATRISGLVQHTDIVPSILELTGVKKDEYDFDGKNLTPLIYGQTQQLHSAVYAEESYTQRKKAIMTNEYKYIHALSKEGSICRYCGKMHGDLEELYDLNEDRDECRNIILEKSHIANELRTELNDWTEYQKTKNEKIHLVDSQPDSDKNLDEKEEREIKKALKELGYF